MPPRRTPEPRRAPALALALACTATLAAAPAHARAEGPGELAGGGALGLAAEPPRLVLGKDAGADLRLQAPADVEEVTFTASVGRVENVHRLPGGGFAARYRPPAERHPQVAIVAAVATVPAGPGGKPRPLDGWLAIPLAGTGDARVKTRPGAEVSLQIGERTFGPRRADAEGRVVLPVVVPPGVTEAHHGFTPVSLRVPETSLLHAVADRAAVHADRAEKVRVLALVVAPHGAARRGDTPVFEPTRGAVTVAPREPGAFEATWTLPAGRAGDERLVVRLPGAPASRAVLEVKAAPGTPVAVAVGFDREAVVAGEGGEVLVTARALDAAGNATPAALALEADGGRLGPAAPAGAAGAAGLHAVEARLAVDPSFRGRRGIVVTAYGPDGVEGGRTLRLEPGPPAAVRFVPPAPVLRGGRPEPALRVVSLDAFGNALSVAPAVTASAGRLALEPAAPAQGFKVSWLAPPAAAADVVELEARAGDARARAGLLQLPPRPALGAGAALGALADARGRFAAPALSLAVERPLRDFDGLGLASTLAWRVEAAAFTDTSRRQGLALLAGASLRRPLGPGAEWFASAGAGAAGLMARSHVLEGQGPRRAEVARDRTGLAPAARLAAGLARPRWPGAPYLELSALGAGAAPGAPFLAVGLALGFRLELQGTAWPRS